MDSDQTCEKIIQAVYEFREEGRRSYHKEIMKKLNLNKNTMTKHIEHLTKREPPRLNRQRDPPRFRKPSDYYELTESEMARLESYDIVKVFSNEKPESE
jgi:DNA-binding MarR family transcriptional regulator